MMRRALDPYDAGGCARMGEHAARVANLFVRPPHVEFAVELTSQTPPHQEPGVAMYLGRRTQ